MSANFSKNSLKHQIAQQIKKLIFEGELEQGEKITELQVAQNLGVSRTSVREAMLLLELEGLLISEPYKDTRVTTISQEEVLELLIPMRLHIEIYALKKGFPIWDEEIKEQFKLILANMRKAIRYEDLSTFIELDIQLHELIVMSSQLENVIRIWESIVHRIRLHFLYQNRKSGTLEKWLVDHEELVDILINGNSVEEAVKTLRKHIVDTNIPEVYLLD
ncbi:MULTISPECIES: GntR family transcriptional regulator [Bacillaceae]|uniref:DNA-binding GntR family transcriptional regulator n=1 Tax=Peribacillus huizhouensis TaxID=1501239 RepID=A0ABR6CMZ1_9BACI|nr:MULTISPECIES: GntR family transcriptional regulator [Bacillaceae]MBA9026380.1 DNA-binding GntR family transcriptional regulator [Peribacillus huizhouensis]